MNRTLSRKQPKLECSVYLEVLYVEPGAAACALSHKQRQRGTEEGWLYSENYVRLPVNLAEHDRKAAEDEREQVHNSFDPGGAFRNV